MRHISNSVFWKNVKDCVGEARYKEIVKVFAVFQDTSQTPEGLRSRVYNEVIPLMLEAARINGCRDMGSGRAYQIEAFEACLEIVIEEYPHLLSDSRSVTEEEIERLKREKIYPKYVEISSRFAKRRLCHGHPTGGFICYCGASDGFTCYCDEKDEKFE